MLGKIKDWVCQTSTLVGGAIFANGGIQKWTDFLTGDLDLRHFLAWHIPVVVALFIPDRFFNNILNKEDKP